MITEVLTGWSSIDVEHDTALTEQLVSDAIRSSLRMREQPWK